MDKDGYHGYYRYERPPQRPWVGLTDEERKDTLQSVNTGFVVDASVVALAIEAKLKEKNVQR